jgi:hypothetical protein
MKRFLLSIVGVGWMVSFASAQCYLVSPERAPTETAAMKRARSFMGTEAQTLNFPVYCQLRLTTQRTPDGEPVWLCGETPEDCRDVAQNEKLQQDAD